MSRTTRTPLDTLDIPDGASFGVSYLRFSGTHSWICRTLQDHEVASAHLRWVMDSANVGDIRVVIQPERGPIGVAASFSMTRRRSLDAWECQEIPDWELCCAEQAAVAEAGRLIAEHQQRRAT